MRWLSLLFTVALLSCGDPQTVETPGTAPGSEEHLGAPLQMAEAQAAPPDREMTIIDTGEDRWHCEPGALQHQLERLPTAEGRCERRGDCRALAGAFEAVCRGPAPPPSRSSPAGPDVQVTLAGEPLRCRRHFSPVGCAITCYHQHRGVDRQELERRFELHVQALRDTFGRDSSAVTQGVSSVPRREHRFVQGHAQLSTELIVNLCPRSPRQGPNSFRTRYFQARSR